MTTLGNLFAESLTLGLLKDNSIIGTQREKLYYYSPHDNYLLQNAFNDSFNSQTNIGQILSLYPEGDSVWVSGRDAFYSVTSKSFRILFQGNDPKKPSNPEYIRFHSFFRINKDEAFLCTETNMFRVQTSAPYRISKIPEMSGKFVRHIYKFKDLYFVSAYKDGLYLLKENHFYKVPVSKDLPQLSTCHSTYIDESGNIWIPTDKGLFKSTAASVIESALKGTVPLFYYYGKEEGVDNTEFNGSGMPTYAVLKNEQLFYPSMGGLVTFKPSELNKKITNAPVFIEKMSIGNEEIEQYSDSIYLPANFKYLALELSTPHFGEPLNLSLEYKLDTTGWKKVQIADNHRITLVNIASGLHRLQIRKRTGFENSDYVYTNLIIVKKKSVYEQWWFALAVLVAFALLYTFFIKMQNRSLNHKKKELQKRVDEQTTELSQSVEVKDLLISIISHDMITPLLHISLISSLLRKGFEKDPQKVDEALADVQSTSERIMSNSTSIINWMKYNSKKIAVDRKTIHLFSMISETMEIYISIAKNKNIEIINDVEKSRFVAADYNILSTIMTNLVSNAVKYTDSGTIRIFTEKKEITEGTVLSVSDTGRGMSEQKLQKVREVLKGNLHVVKTDGSASGLGYVMISELVKIHNLSISVESEAGKGTKASLFIS